MPRIGPFHLWRRKESKPKRTGKVLAVGAALVAGAGYGIHRMRRRRASVAHG